MKSAESGVGVVYHIIELWLSFSHSRLRLMMVTISVSPRS